MTTLHLAKADLRSLDVDALVVGIAKVPVGEVPPPRGRRRRRAAAAPDSAARVIVVAAADVERAFEGRLAQTLTTLGAKGTLGEVTTMPAGRALRAPVLVAVGLGDVRPDGSYDLEVLRRGAGSATRALAGTARVGLALPAPDAASVGALGEGALFGAYAYRRYRTGEGVKAPVEAVTIVTDHARDKAAKDAALRAVSVGAAVTLVRDLVNTPPGDLPPQALAEAAVAAVDGLPVKTSVLAEDALRAGGYGGLIGVGQGSVNPPRLVKLSYAPRGAKVHLALVGKGITFDSGGLSLKPAASMEWMKSDMAGAAAVIAATAVIARLGLPVKVTTWAACAENMPSGTAQRPSDVLTTYGGKTVEVLNTDAEGRLVLADALVAAGEEQPDAIVDVATLTGAQLVALGSKTSAIMANDDAWREVVHRASVAAGEAMWPMPLPEELRSSMDSEVADIANMGDKYGGMLVAGLFLREFVPAGTPWAHLDIAGPSFNTSAAYGYTPKGGTGSAVRTLVVLAEELAAGRALPTT